jgi:nucleoid-associated protein YgaU
VSDLGIAIDGLAVQVSGDTATITGTAATQADCEKAILLVGNTSGIATVDDQLSVREAAPEAAFYTVQPGDTLWKIAEAQYGDGGKYAAIFEANRPMLENPDLIYPGQSLRIPPV